MKETRKCDPGIDGQDRGAKVSAAGPVRKGRIQITNS
jgi:hypothetical protein